MTEPAHARGGHSRATLVRLVAGAAVCTAGSAALVVQGPLLSTGRLHWTLVAVGAWVALLLVLVLVLRTAAPAGRRTTVAILVLGAACCQLPGVLQPPLGSTDAYRYVWDGRVQLSGVSPYRYAPADDALAHLRDPVLFPSLGPGDPSGITTVRPLPGDRGELRAFTRNDDRIAVNRPQVTTIYPPIAQAWFAAVAMLTPWSLGTLGIQLATALLAVALTWLLARLLAGAGADLRWAALWGWSPLVAYEAGSNGHVDVLTAALVVGACAVLSRRPGPAGRVVGGLVLGLAVATKLSPLLLLPAVTALRRGGGREALVPLSALAGTAATYVPHLLAAGSLVMGFLPSYLVEEGFDDGRSRFAVLGLLQLPPPARPPVALAVGVLVALAAVRTADPRRPWDAGCWVLGAALLLATPSYPWYALPLLALATLARRPEWAAVAVAGSVAYALRSGAEVVPVVWLASALVVGAAAVWRWWSEGRWVGSTGAGQRPAGAG